MGLLDNVQSIEDRPEFVKLLLYGTPGVGKTVFAASAPNPLFIDFERSTETLRSWPEFKGIDVVTPDGFRNSEGLLRVIKALPSSDYQTVVIDTISSAQNWQLAMHMREVETKQKRSRFLPLFQDYRISTEIFKEIFAILQEMDINVIINAHHHEFRNAEGNLEAIRPDLTPRLSDAIKQLLNIVAFYKKIPSSQPGKTVRQMYVNETTHIAAKNRLGIQETYLTDPTWETLTSRK